DAKAGKSTPMVADYIFEKDKLFANLNLSDDELALYERQFQYFRDQLPTPDLVIYLQASPKVLRTRLARKGVPEEKAISARYLEQVSEAYEHFFFHYTASDLLIVNTDDIDFVRSNEDLRILLRRLKEPVHGTQYFLPLGNGEKGGPLNPLRALRSPGCIAAIDDVDATSNLQLTANRDRLSLRCARLSANSNWPAVRTDSGATLFFAANRTAASALAHLELRSRHPASRPTPLPVTGQESEAGGVASRFGRPACGKIERRSPPGRSFG
ncbi:MAG TPA: deoxynucleoside kinase, partial [Acidobacteriaceae bacterium]|nr:deoxynucleoside kinase [Acidobacteriaceae bacterium]